MKKIGLLGGLGPESTLLYYSYITRKYYEDHGDYAYPEIIIYSVCFQEHIDEAFETYDNIRAAMESLHRAGADFAVAACNTIHLVYDAIVKDLPLPWISIMDAVAERIKEQDLTKVALLGTKFTMQGTFYPTTLSRYGIEVVTPPIEAQERIDDIIFSDLVRADVKPERKQYLLDCVEDLKQEGAEGVILGCTELPFAIEQKDTPLPVFNSSTIHAKKALDLALADD